MTTLQDQHPAVPESPPAFRPLGGGRPLAAAIAVFLGGYLLLLSLSGQLGTLAASLLSGGDRAPSLPPGYIALVVSQFVFALLVVVAGLLLARRPNILTALGLVVVVVGPVVFLLLQGARLSGALRLPFGGEFGGAFASILGNSWFHVVLVVGVAWLLCRPAGVGWFSLLGALILLPVPYALMRAGVEGGVLSLIMFTLSALIGAGIVAAGRPWRVEP